MYCVIDANNFFVSCEQLFDPSLHKKPVVVLSNNDGCIVSRSDEAKKLGIKMADAFFKYKHLVKTRGLKFRSTNFALYADMSARIMQVIKDSNLPYEIYSIDEAFIDLQDLFYSDILPYCHDLKSKIEQWTGIPVSVGIGPSKTLAKAANELAKKYSYFKGVCRLSTGWKDDLWLKKIPIANIWGIGYRSANKLKTKQIETALDFKRASDTVIKQLMHISGIRTLFEIRGRPCFDLKNLPDPRQTILTSRTFGEPVRCRNRLSQALASFVSIASEKLRAQSSVAGYLKIFIVTNRFYPEDFYNESRLIQLEKPTAYTPHLIRAAEQGLQSIFKPKLAYKRAGILLLDIQSNNPAQLGLWDNANQYNQEKSLMKVVDHLNSNWGQNTIRFAATGTQHQTPDIRSFKARSPRYTTRWEELLKV